MIRALLAGVARVFGPRPVDLFTDWFASATMPVRPLERWTPSDRLYDDYAAFVRGRGGIPMRSKAFADALRLRCHEGPRLITQRPIAAQPSFNRSVLLLRCWPLGLRAPRTFSQGDPA